MTRDVRDRLALYAREPIEVRRIALTIEQVRQYNPPPNFVKETDTRTSGYRDRFDTDECWELDALAPTVIAGLIRSEIVGLLDQQTWNDAKVKEAANRNLLHRLCRNWSNVEKHPALQSRQRVRLSSG
jgi:hypothetical protein